MDTNEFKRIHPSARRVWTINGIIESLFIFAIALVVFYFAKQWLILAGASALCLYIIAVHPNLEYKQWTYKITDTNVCYNHGIYVKKFTNIPISRIQHLEIKQGPVLKHYKLSNVQIYTAGQSHDLVALPTSEAEEIVNTINLIISKEEAHGEN